jgi:hypothetical protein
LALLSLAFDAFEAIQGAQGEKVVFWGSKKSPKNKGRDGSAWFIYATTGIELHIKN